MLVEKYRSEVFRTIYAVLRDESEAEDASQEVFMKIYNSLPSYQNQGFKTWIIRIAVNHAIDIKRRKGRFREELSNTIESAGPETESVETVFINKEQQRFVRQKLNELPENYREVIYGFYIDEKSYQQMAIEQNVQVKTIETKLYRARHWMKSHWKEDEF
ncbi:sigma-70 family RNA polymerase sigma factor [Mesobacillus harenae]|uniref:sigma-70 family RNA polymerase sigma factor n=1 Tax=Mesobacillus harenae TaxID=2213203 RepID=UPI0018D5C0E2|nr:sigma-70 family RNA polymerase sigma factor [Mesobacillus harenae]